MGERVLTKEQAMNLEGIEVLAANPSTSGALSVLQVARELARACRSHEALREQSDRLRAALTQSAATIEALRENTDVWAARAEKAERERDGWEESALQKDGLLLDSLLENARLERTVERLREALERIAGRGCIRLEGNFAEHDPVYDAHEANVNEACAALAASSPDHAGAPAGEAGEGDK